MGFRFRKSIKVMPGVRVNLGKSGISTSIGVKGATVNVRPGRKSRLTVGLPGTGISYSTQLDDAHQETHAPTGVQSSSSTTSLARVIRIGCVCVAIIGALLAAAGDRFGWGMLVFGAGAAFALRGVK